MVQSPLQSLGSSQKHPPRGSLGLGIHLKGLGQLLMLVICTEKSHPGKSRPGAHTPGNGSGSVLIIRVWNPLWSNHRPTIIRVWNPLW